ncbi:hypothetical protein DAPPUDRAFT_332753 [Daphnia pulex]|uniref:Integrase core domain-containing protein n=1 Tax=Daphnia pulex TaxID=6669 RepID=E9HQW2_DAPPU|nr:hypothetical protein DAPPUDRAFT_332753 [Daphnia pulex]|eukprot:EFX65847.1 hypothetical protein DAPPUDRAFT_332753 [Daphnia pulex]
MSVQHAAHSENYGVCDFMLAARSEICNSFIAGKSVHNQRIERPWRDLFEAALEPFNVIFMRDQWPFKSIVLDGSSVPPHNDVGKMQEAVRKLPTYPTDECRIDDFLMREEMRNLNFDANVVTLENAFAMYMTVKAALEMFCFR